MHVRILTLACALVALPWAAWAAEEPPRYEDVFAAAREVWVEHDDRNVDDERIDSDVLYVLGNVANTMFHEFGHALVSEFDLPVEGSEEDEVDALANVVMVSESDSPYLDAMIESVADDWFAQGEYDEESGPSEDGHAVSSDRAYAVVCILVGADPEYFADTADNAGLDDTERADCAEEYEYAHTRWDEALAPYYLGDDEEPTREIVVNYGEPDAEHRAVAELLHASGLVEDIAEQMAWTIRFPNPIRIDIELCGEENAFWDPEARRVILCYEIVEGYRQRAMVM